MDLRKLKTLIDLVQNSGISELEISEGEPALGGAPSLRLVERQRQEALQAEVVREAQTHPNIVALLSQFEGQLKHVRPLVPPTPSSG